MSERTSLWLKYYSGGEVLEVSILVDRGIVVRVERGFVRFREADQHFDLRGGVALPGFIDIHTHLRGLDLSYKEDERSGTLAAARGGLTSVIDMPNTRPRINSVSSLEMKLSALREKAVVDYGVWIGLPRDPRELVDMISRRGVVGLKIYPEDLSDFERISREISIDSLRVIVHAEDPDFTSENCERGYRWYCRPVDSEIRAVYRVYQATRDKSFHVHITHVTNIYTASVAKRLGMTIDTCPHYLYLDSETERTLGCVAKVNPPLRHPIMREMLLESIRERSLIDIISTDHAPHTVEEKSRDFSECPSGIASAEFYSSLLLDLYNRDLVTLSRIAELSSIKPAEFLGLGRYGCVEPGCIASFTIVDPYREIKIRSSDMISRARNTPYDNTTLKGDTYATVVRGRVVYLNGEFIDLRGGVAVNEKTW
ncbi:MAG: dihydroorotase [Sulfolobales archaeon]